MITSVHYASNNRYWERNLEFENWAEAKCYAEEELEGNDNELLTITSENGISVTYYWHNGLKSSWTEEVNCNE